MSGMSEIVLPMAHFYRLVDIQRNAIACNAEMATTTEQKVCCVAVYCGAREPKKNIFNVAAQGLNYNGSKFLVW